MNHLWFWKLQEAAANPLFMVSNLQDVAVKPFSHFYNETLMVLELQEAAANPVLMVSNLKEVAVKQFQHFYNETFMVLEASGGCCESSLDGFESPGGCGETIYTLLQ